MKWEIDGVSRQTGSMPRKIGRAAGAGSPRGRIRRAWRVLPRNLRWAILIGIPVLALIAAGIFLPEDPYMRSLSKSGSNQAASLPAPATATAPAAPVAMKWNPTPQEIADRVKLLAQFRRENVFGDIDMKYGVGHAVAGQAWYALDFGDKKKFAGVVMAWCLDQDRDCRMVIVADRFTNHDIARYSLDLGFEVY